MGDGDGAVLRGELHRVADQVHQDLAHAGMVAGCRHLVRPAELQRLELGIGGGDQHVERLTRDFEQADRIRSAIMHHAGIEPGHLHHVVEQGEQVPPAHAYAPERFALPIVDGAVDLFLHDLAVAVDRAQRSSDVVGEGGERAVLGTGGTLDGAEAILHVEADLAPEPCVLERDRRVVGERGEKGLVGGQRPGGPRTASRPVTAPPTTSGTAIRRSSATSKRPCSRSITSSVLGAPKRATRSSGTPCAARTCRRPSASASMSTAAGASSSSAPRSTVSRVT
jgi:hypothetical protein